MNEKSLVVIAYLRPRGDPVRIFSACVVYLDVGDSVPSRHSVHSFDKVLLLHRILSDPFRLLTGRCFESSISQFFRKSNCVVAFVDNPFDLCYNASVSGDFSPCKHFSDL